MTPEARIERLERNQRVLVGVLLMALLALTLASMPGQGAPPETVRCSGVEIVNSDGDVLARLGTDDRGAVGLFVNDGDGRVRVSVTHDDEQSALFIRDDKGDTRVGVAQFSHGGGGVALHGPDAKGAAVLYYKGSGSLSFYDVDGTASYSLPRDRQ